MSDPAVTCEGARCTSPRGARSVAECAIEMNGALLFQCGRCAADYLRRCPAAELLTLEEGIRRAESIAQRVQAVTNPAPAVSAPLAPAAAPEPVQAAAPASSGGGKAGHRVRVACALSFAAGVLLSLEEFFSGRAAYMNPDAGIASPDTAIFHHMLPGLTLALAPALIVTAMMLVSLSRAMIAAGQQYRAWKRTLTPEQRRAVQLAEWMAASAAAVGAHEWLKHRNEEASQWYTAKMMGGQRWQEYKTAQMTAMAMGGGPKARHIRRDIMTGR